MAKKERVYTDKTFTIQGPASFPFLHKTAKDEDLYPEDRYKITVSPTKADFQASELAVELKRFVDGWYPTPTDLIDGTAGLKDLDIDLNPADKYHSYKVGRLQFTLKKNPNAKKNAHKPKVDVYDETGQLMTADEDICRISNGCTVMAVVRPSCYGDADKAAAYNAGIEACGQDVQKLTKYMQTADKPIFGVNLELFAVQLLEARAGSNPKAEEVTSHIVGATAATPDMMDTEPDPVPADKPVEQMTPQEMIAKATADAIAVATPEAPVAAPVAEVSSEKLPFAEDEAIPATEEVNL